MALIEQELQEGRRSRIMVDPKRPTVARPAVDKPLTLEEHLDAAVKNFGQDTSTAFISAHDEALTNPQQHWRTGHPILDTMLRSLKSGMWLFGGVENCGKSNFANVLEIGILDNTEDAIVVDIILDDDRETRIHQLAAARGHLPMDLMTVPSLMEENDKRRQQREKAYFSLAKQYSSRLEIIDSASWGEKGAYLVNIEAYLRLLRLHNPTKKIWVTLDAFDDVKCPKDVAKDNRVEHISAWIKSLCNELGAKAPFLVFAIKHLNKGNRGRYVTGDAFGGSGHLTYDAKVAMIAYSEMGELGGSASIYFHPDSKDITKKNPILEVFIQKNKRGGGKGRRLYYNQWPSEYFCSECSEGDQEMYAAMTADAIGAKK